MRKTDKMTRKEWCECDFDGCAAKADVDHHVVAPKRWSQFTDIPVESPVPPQEYHLCPSCADKVRQFIKNREAR